MQIKPSFKPYKASWQDLFGTTDLYLSLVIVGLTGFAAAAYFSPILYANDRLDFIGFLLSVITLIPILTLLRQNRLRAWQNDLPKVLNVKLCYGDKVQVVFTGIPLIDRSDLRAQAQTITKILLNTNQQFPLKPFFKKTPIIRVAQDENKLIYQGEPVELFSVQVDMNFSLQEANQNPTLFSPHLKALIAQLKDEQYLEVFYPFELDAARCIALSQRTTGSL